MIAIYTCIIGHYDVLQQPAVIDDGFDFICFVGKGEKTSMCAGTAGEENEAVTQEDAEIQKKTGASNRVGAWEIRELPLSFADPALASRYPKMHPHELLPEYECSVWIDGNIAIADDTLYRCARIKEAAGVKYSGVPHPSRDCTYDEASKCRDMRYISYFRLFGIWLFLGLHRFPRHAGLMENNLIFRRHNDPSVVAFDTLWWDKVLHFSRRDQLSVMWCLRRCGIPVDYLLPHRQNARNNSGFKYLHHSQ